ncbi:MAG TPA: DUF938 domain-containing protein [Gammaproteobacteria bacterium]|nr:DUF938 domain-containing protein [Gammaproteobacteria bacterium]
MRKPFSESCEQNKEPILAVLREVLAGCHRVLEIGSGTGQHAIYFARHLPHLTWLTSDVSDQHAGIRAWLEEAGLPNVRPPLALDVDQAVWPAERIDAVFSANTAHIMAWPSVQHMFEGVARILAPDGVLCLYGPFNEGGRYTSPGNARFDAWLRQRDPDSGVRDVEDLDALAAGHGMCRVADYPMPTENRTLVWSRAS